MNITLYKAEQLSQLENFVDKDSGEIDMLAFESAQLVLLEKQRAVMAYIKNSLAFNEMLKQAKAEMDRKIKVNEKNAEWLKEYLMASMKNNSITEILASDGTFKATLHLERDKSVVIEDGAIFPPELCNPPKPLEPSKKSIEAAIMAGEPISGAHIVKKDRLTIS